MSNNNSEEVDRLSELPEELLLQIISLLPVKFAVRTSVVARRFRNLWTASSSMELDRSDFPNGYLFNNATFRFLGCHDPSIPLLNFCLTTKPEIRPFHINCITKWLNHANSLGMRYLSLHIHSKTIETLFPLIIGLQSLQTLVIHAVDINMEGYFSRYQPLIPPSFSQTQLKYLHIKAKIFLSDLRFFILGLRNLEHLWVEPLCKYDVNLSSPSVKILKLNSKSAYSKISLSFPNLEFLDLNVGLDKRNQFHIEMPILKSAVVTIPSLYEECVPVLCDILRSVSNVSELTVHIGTLHPKRLVGATRKRKRDEFDLFHLLVEPGKDMIIFPNLRSLRLSMCFYENALQDLICLLRHSPVIDSLHLIHADQPSDWKRTCWSPEAWHSKLPQNSEGNIKYADFMNLKTGDTKSEAIKLLSSGNPFQMLKKSRSFLPKSLYRCCNLLSLFSFYIFVFLMVSLCCMDELWVNYQGSFSVVSLDNYFISG